MTDVKPEKEPKDEKKEEDKVDPKEYEKLRDLLLQKCSWIEDLNDLLRLIWRRKFGSPHSIQSGPYLLYSLYHYIIFGEPLPCTKTAEEWRDIIWYYGGAGKYEIEDFVESRNSIKVESMRKTAEECERVGEMKLSEIELSERLIRNFRERERLEKKIRREVKAWAKSADERLRRAAEMTIEEFAKSDIWEEIVRDPQMDIFNIAFSVTKAPEERSLSVADVLEEISDKHPMYDFFSEEILHVLWWAELDVLDASDFIVMRDCIARVETRPCIRSRRYYELQRRREDFYYEDYYSQRDF